MEQSFGDAGWDILLSHKGDWCLYESRICLESSGCINCEIYKKADNKWHEVIKEVIKKEVGK